MNDPNAHQQATPGGCPSRDVLADLALGKLPLGAIEAIGRHVEACPACQTILETLDGLEDSVVADLKEQASPPPLDPRLQEQIREAEQISRVVWQGPSPGVAEEPLPQRLGQYELGEPIGRGGMGTVYKAVHTRLKRPVAVKVLPAGRLRDPQAIARFQREMEAVGRLDHPNLVRAHDAGEAAGQHFLVMEFLDGEDLARLVRRSGPLSVPDACEVVRQAALGLQHAHQHGLVHRDVKPSNLMLNGRGQVKVLDLGLARLNEETRSEEEATANGQVFGTGDFIAPEQGQDTRQADARSDIYSLGCTLYFLLTGHAPFSGPAYDTFVKKVMAHAQQPIPPAAASRRDLPDAVAAILERMTAKEPDQRFQTAGEVVQALETFAAGNDLTGVVPERTTHRTESAPGPHPRLTKNGLWMAGLVLVFAGLAFLGYRYGPRVLYIQRNLPNPAEVEQINKEVNAALIEAKQEVEQEVKELQREMAAKSEPSEAAPK